MILNWTNYEPLDFGYALEQLSWCCLGGSAGAEAICVVHCHTNRAACLGWHWRTRTGDSSFKTVQLVELSCASRFPQKKWNLFRGITRGTNVQLLGSSSKALARLKLQRFADAARGPRPGLFGLSWDPVVITLWNPRIPNHPTSVLVEKPADKQAEDMKKWDEQTRKKIETLLDWSKDAIAISISFRGSLQGSDPGARLQHSAGRKTGEWQGPDNCFEGQETNFQRLQEQMFGLTQRLFMFKPNAL